MNWSNKQTSNDIVGVELFPYLWNKCAKWGFWIFNTSLLLVLSPCWTTKNNTKITLNFMSWLFVSFPAPMWCRNSSDFHLSIFLSHTESSFDLKLRARHMWMAVDTYPHTELKLLVWLLALYTHEFQIRNAERWSPPEISIVKYPDWFRQTSVDTLSRV